jgi:hypothetical protein
MVNILSRGVHAFFFSPQWTLVHSIVLGLAGGTSLLIVATTWPRLVKLLLGLGAVALMVSLILAAADFSLDGYVSQVETRARVVQTSVITMLRVIASPFGGLGGFR